MRRRKWAGGAALVLALLAGIPAGGCGAKKDINAATEISGAPRWYAGAAAPRVLGSVREIFEAAGYHVTAVDEEAGRVETDWSAESSGGTHGWLLARWPERQKFIAHVAPSQLQTDKGESLISVLLQLRWEERPPQGSWRIKEDGGAPSQNATFQKVLRELDERVTQLGGRRS